MRAGAAGGGAGVPAHGESQACRAPPKDRASWFLERLPPASAAPVRRLELDACRSDGAAFVTAETAYTVDMRELMASATTKVQVVAGVGLLLLPVALLALVLHHASTALDRRLTALEGARTSALRTLAQEAAPCRPARGSAPGLHPVAFWDLDSQMAGAEQAALGAATLSDLEPVAWVADTGLPLSGGLQEATDILRRLNTFRLEFERRHALCSPSGEGDGDAVARLQQRAQAALGEYRAGLERFGVELARAHAHVGRDRAALGPLALGLGLVSFAGLGALAVYGARLRRGR